MIEIIRVYIIIRKMKATGWEIWVKIIEIKSVNSRNILITEDSLHKILALGVKERFFLLIKGNPFWIYKTHVFDKLLIILGSIIGILFGGWIFISQYKHLLVMLVSLEIMALGLLWLIRGWLGFGGGEEFFILIFLRIAACEGRLGLAVLVCLVRSHGSDKFEGVSVLIC